MNILALETSFDETALAIVEDGRHLRYDVLSSSSSLHKRFGGVLPELAARKQLEYILPMISETFSHHPLETIDAIAVTTGPGLIGSLLIGVETAKTIAFVTQKPIIPVNHIHAHPYANIIQPQDHIPTKNHIMFPAIALVASGGHTELFCMDHISSLRWIGGTIDDAAGEAFDKTARLLGFEHKGGIAIEEAAKQYNPQSSSYRISLPRPMLHEKTFTFSFSGLKTAVLRSWNTYSKDQQSNEEIRAAFAYEIQEAITDVLVEKTLFASRQYNAKSILLSGGVAANERLRQKFCERTTLPVFFPMKELCTDNAAMIGSAAYFLGTPKNWRDIEATPDLSVEI